MARIQFDTEDKSRLLQRTVAGYLAHAIEDLPEPRTDAEPYDVLLSENLQKLLNRLPSKHRAIVVLRYQEDLDPSDIAVHLEMPVATVKSTLHRALGMLRRALERPRVPAQETLLKREAV